MASPRPISRPSKPWSRAWPTASASPCATPRSTIRTASSVRSVRMDRRWFPANHCLRDDAAGLWQCAALPALGAPKPETGGSTRFSKPDDRACRGARAVAGGRGLRHAVFGVGHHRAQLSRHRPGGRRGARPGGRRSQHRAGLHGRRAHHLRRHARDPGKVEFVHPLHNLAIVSYDPKLIGTTPVQERQVARPAHRAGRNAVGGRHAAPTASSTCAPRRSRRCRPSSCRCRAPCSSARATSKPSSS